jgi:hypothetical protein
LALRILSVREQAASDAFPSISASFVQCGTSTSRRYARQSITNGGSSSAMKTLSRSKLE